MEVLSMGRQVHASDIVRTLDSLTALTEADG